MILNVRRLSSLKAFILFFQETSEGLSSAMHAQTNIRNIIFNFNRVERLTYDSS